MAYNRDEELVDKILELNEQKMRPSEIALIINRSSSTVRNVLRKKEIPIKWSIKKEYKPTYRPVTSQAKLKEELVCTIRALERAMKDANENRIKYCSKWIEKYSAML